MYCTKYIVATFCITPFADAKVFHAGTKTLKNGDIMIAGGRALYVTALGNTIGEAQAKALELCQKVTFVKILATVRLLVKMLKFLD